MLRMIRIWASQITKLVASPWFTWVAGLFGIVVFYVLKQVEFLSSKIPDEILETPTPAFIGVLLPVTLWIIKLLLFDLSQIMAKAPKELIYHDAQYTWIYSSDGSVRGTCLFDIHNLSKSEVSRLPNESLVWYNKILKKDVLFRIIFRDGDRLHRFEEDSPSIEKIDHIIDAIRNRSGYELGWSPTVTPPLLPDERLLYSVDIGTPGTELDAFASKGTCVGFPVSRFTRKARLTAIAPEGFKFVAHDPFFISSEIGLGGASVLNAEGAISATVSPDGTLLKIENDFPKSGTRYSAHFHFERKQ
jgi:hypothetical protein